MIALLRSMLWGISLRVWLIAAAVAVAALWSGYCYQSGYASADAAWRAKNLEAQLAEVRAKLAANEEIRKEAEADAAKAEADAEKQKELLDELRKAPPSCALTPDHVDGVRRIDQSP